METELQTLGRRLVGHWTMEATHPAMPGTVIEGSSQFEWLAGDQFLIIHTHYDHPEFPDAISIVGDTDGLRMHYFDARGVHRLFDVTITDDGWEALMSRRAPARSFASNDAPFSQRMTYTIHHGDHTIAGLGELSHDDVTWNDDLEITYRRAT